MGDVQIAAREPDISEHVIVQIREAREFSGDIGRGLRAARGFAAISFALRLS